MDILELRVTLQQEKHLCPERVIFGSYIEFFKKGIIFKVLQDQFSVQSLGKHLRNGCFPGADDAFNAKQEGLAQHLREITGGDGADASFEVVGAAAPIDLAIRCVRKGGQVILVGNLQPSTPFPLQEVVTRQITLRGSCSCAGEYPEAIRRIEDGSIQVEPLLSAVAPLEEGAGWFQRLYDNKEGLLKVVLRPE